MTGVALIAAGVLLGLFVAYLLWGTGLSESHGQQTLKTQFKAEARQAHPAKPGQAAAPVLNFDNGAAIGIIRIPRIGLEKYIVQGTAEDDLQKGPGHYPATPLPGQPGNVGIAGHRTTYGAPFYNLNELSRGDHVLITMPDGVVYTYSVTGSQVVAPNDVAVVAPTKDDQLTLTTCNPRFSASTRLVVTAALVGASQAAPPAPVNEPKAAPPAVLTTGQSSAIPSIVLFGLLGIAVWLASWALTRRAGWFWWIPGAAVFLVVLFFFFENLTRILPASV